MLFFGKDSLVACLILLAYASSGQAHVSAQEDHPEKKQGTIVLLEPESVVLVSTRGRNLLRATVNLGKLRCGKRYRISLSLSSEQYPVSFEGIDADWKSESVVFTDNLIPVDGSSDITLTFDVPSAHPEQQIHRRVTLLKKGQTVAEVFLKFSLEGNLYLQERSVGLEATDDGFPPRSLPFLCDANINSVACELSEDLKGLIDAEIKMEGFGRGRVILRSAEDFFMKSKVVTGSLKLKTADFASSDSVPVHLHQAPVVDFSPHKIFFVDDPNGGLVGAAMVRVRNDHQVSQLKIRIDGFDTEVEATPLNQQILRLKIHVDDQNSVREQSGSFRWVYTLQGKSDTVNAQWSR